MSEILFDRTIIFIFIGIASALSSSYARKRKEHRVKYHFAADGSCSCPIDGKCCECGKPCCDHDLVGNQTELGFPFYWCGECINTHFDEDAVKSGADTCE